jgi:LPPG:FO 2-phospho-L-lactate transferase
VLAVPGIRTALRECAAPVVAISPIVAGAALKGPTAKIMEELAVPATASAVAAHYADFLQGFIVDESDRDLVPEIAARGVRCSVAQAVMNTLDDRINLAHTALELLATC